MFSVQVKPQRLVVRYFAVSTAYLVIAVTLGLLMQLGIATYSSFQAHVHIALIGFVSLSIMGAMYQIVPTLQGVELYNPRLAEAQFWLMNIGVLGLSASFLSGRAFVAPMALLVALASYLFVYIIFATYRRAKAPFNLTMKFFLSALVYFSIAIAIGFILAASSTSQSSLFYKGNYLVGHAHLALLAFVGLTIMGAMYQMLPMLSLRELHSARLGEAQFWLSNLGIVGFSLGALSARKSILMLSSVVVVVGAYVFLYNMYKTLAKKGGKFDISVKFFASALVYFAIACTLGVAIAIFHKNLLWIDGLLSAHAHLTAMGFVTLTIMGAMYHLVPMLVWMTRYAEKLGREPVPTIAEMFNQRWANIQFAGANLGVAGYFVGLLTSDGLGLISAFVFLISTYGFAYIMYRVMSPWGN